MKGNKGERRDREVVIIIIIIHVKSTKSDKETAFFDPYYFYCFEILDDYLETNVFFSLRAEYIATVQQDTELCSRLSKNVALYMEKVRNAVVWIFYIICCRLKYFSCYTINSCNFFFYLIYHKLLHSNNVLRLSTTEKYLQCSIYRNS